VTATVAPVSPAARRRLVFAAAAVLLAAADTYVVVLALPSIMNDVGLSVDRLSEAAPIISGFLLGYVAMLPLLGRLSDIYGRRPVFAGCLVAFAVGSLLTAAAEGLPMVVVGRTIQGLGGGGLVPVTLALVADGWPPGRRGVPLGVVGAVQELGSVLGPLYGAVIVEHSTWRTIFWINLPLAAALGAAFVLSGGRAAAAREPQSAAPSVAPAATRGPAARRDVIGALLLLATAGAGALALVQPAAIAADATWGALYSPLGGGGALATPMALIALALLIAALLWELVAPFGVAPLLALRRAPTLLHAADWTGALLLAGALGCVILSFASADTSREVLGSTAAIALPAAALLTLLWVLREHRARDPLVPLQAFRHPAAIGALLVNLAAGAALMAVLADVPIFARATAHPDSQIDAALVLVRFLAAVPAGALLGGLLTERISHRATAGLGMALGAAMLAVMSTWPATALSDSLWHLPITQSDVVLAACGLGFGLAIAPVNAAILGAVRASLHGLASALVVVARMVGMLVGLSVLTAVGLRSFYATQAHIPSPLRLCPATPAACPAYDALVRQAIVDELHTVFAGAAICSGVAALLALALLRRGTTVDSGTPSAMPVAAGAGG
jgi:MFS family permease